MTRKSPTVAPKANPVNPSHHKGFIAERQWAENYSIELRSRFNEDIIKAIIASWGDKYTDRVGRKDPAIQELKKGMWYLRFAATFHITTDPTNLVPFQRALDATLDDKDFPAVLQRLGRPQSRANEDAILAALGVYMTDLRDYSVRDYTRECVAVAFAISMLETGDACVKSVEQILLNDVK